MHLSADRLVGGHFDGHDGCRQALPVDARVIIGYRFRARKAWLLSC